MINVRHAASALFAAALFSAVAAQTDLGKIAMESDLQGVRDVVSSWEYAIGGSNVVMSITNYESGAYLSGVPKLIIKELRGGEYREIYNSQQDSHALIGYELEAFKTNTLTNPTNGVQTQIITVSNEIISVYQELMDVKADKRWGIYTSDGQPAPSNTVTIVEPYTEFAAGLSYRRIACGTGTIGVLCDIGAPVYTQGDEGTFKFQDDGGTNWFGFAKTDSYTIGCNTDGLEVMAGNIVKLTYNVTMSGHPDIWYVPTLDVRPITWTKLEEEGTDPVVSWEENPPAGKKICYIGCHENQSGFFKATIEQHGSSKFMTNMPADLMGGILCTNTADAVHTHGIIRPRYDGTSVHWDFIPLND